MRNNPFQTNIHSVIRINEQTLVGCLPKKSLKIHPLKQGVQKGKVSSKLYYW